ncbi:hypothetical protein [Pseudopelagicola sp. nBUS_19]|uniref:hypothetical protein n=1 Tax=Pseudopelagicola sp. nBUS_19 TaxID=3395316 RepID=UPI003EBAA393
MTVSGVWEPGARVDLNLITAKFRVSKTHFNEAAQMLVQESADVQIEKWNVRQRFEHGRN